jgi:hypothetical protein
MNKCTDKRKEFVKNFVNDPTKGLDEMEQQIKEARKCRNTTDIIKYLSNHLFLSQATIWNDYSKD